MARHQVVTVGSEWTELTANDVSEIVFQNRGITSLLITVTDGAAPNPSDDGFAFLPGQGHNMLLAEFSLGVTGGSRVWARFLSGSGLVMVSHA
ncbi:MAG: hypothetical protein RID15_01630 [Marinovum algicola]|uniref:hypothetical protein n=1 Tax=Roseobacteraceae TaxID=2854170 RepID=UPI0032EF16FD